MMKFTILQINNLEIRFFSKVLNLILKYTHISFVRIVQKYIYFSERIFNRNIIVMKFTNL